MYDCRSCEGTGADRGGGAGEREGGKHTDRLTLNMVEGASTHALPA